MSERSAVQNPMLKYAQEVGWEYVPPEQALALRGGDTGPFFTEILEAQLCRLNPGVVDDARLPEVLRRLGLLRPTIDGNRDALAWLKGDNSVFVPEQNRERNVVLIDFETPENNIFQVSDEWWIKGTELARPAGELRPQRAG
jgi:type I restriction enzyme R subunit